MFIRSREDSDHRARKTEVRAWAAELFLRSLMT